MVNTEKAEAIEKLLTEARAKIKEAQAIADEHNISFRLTIDPDNCNCTYYPAKKMGYWENENRWESSSMNC